MKKFRRSSVANSQKPERAVSITQFFSKCAVQVRGPPRTKTAVRGYAPTKKFPRVPFPTAKSPKGPFRFQRVTALHFVMRSAKVVALMEHWFLTLNCDRIQGRDV